MVLLIAKKSSILTHLSVRLGLNELRASPSQLARSFSFRLRCEPLSEIYTSTVFTKTHASCERVESGLLSCIKIKAMLYSKF